jgi:hypothetical protein
MDTLLDKLTVLDGLWRQLSQNKTETAGEYEGEREEELKVRQLCRCVCSAAYLLCADDWQPAGWPHRRRK